MSHTYAVHVTVEAGSDSEALEAARAIERVLEFNNLPSALAVSTTDADDWAEHIPSDGLCCTCGTSVDRERTGIGRRQHFTCASALFAHPYPIEDR